MSNESVLHPTLATARSFIPPPGPLLQQYPGCSSFTFSVHLLLVLWMIWPGPVHFLFSRHWNTSATSVSSLFLCFLFLNPLQNGNLYFWWVRCIHSSANYSLQNVTLFPNFPPPKKKSSKLCKKNYKLLENTLKMMIQKFHPNNTQKLSPHNTMRGADSVLTKWIRQRLALRWNAVEPR